MVIVKCDQKLKHVEKIKHLNYIQADNYDGLDLVTKSLTCSFLAGVLCPTAAGNCSGWCSGEVDSAALEFPFSVCLFSCGCLASESAPDSVVMVNHAGEEERGGDEGETRWVSLLWTEQLWCECRDVDIVWQQIKRWNSSKWLQYTQAPSSIISRVPAADNGKRLNGWRANIHNISHDKLYLFNIKVGLKMDLQQTEKSRTTSHWRKIFSLWLYIWPDHRFKYLEIVFQDWSTILCLLSKDFVEQKPNIRAIFFLSCSICVKNPSFSTDYLHTSV